MIQPPQVWTVLCPKPISIIRPVGISLCGICAWDIKLKMDFIIAIEITNVEGKSILVDNRSVFPFHSELYYGVANNNLKLTFLLDGGKPMAG